MTTNNDEIVCECGHGIDHHHENGVGCSRWLVNDYCECKQFTDARLAALRAENERLHAEIACLTPTETNVLPTKPGWYWRVNDEIDEWEPVHVRADLDGRLSTESRDDDGTVVIDLVLHGKRWSKEPIPMPEIEKEGERI